MVSDIGPELVTTDQNELLETLDTMRLWGGGDCPESALNGILASLKYALPRSYVYIFTDAIAKDFALDTDVLTMIQKKQTSVRRINIENVFRFVDENDRDFVFSSLHFF